MPGRKDISQEKSSANEEERSAMETLAEVLFEQFSRMGTEKQPVSKPELRHKKGKEGKP